MKGDLGHWFDVIGETRENIRSLISYVQDARGGM
jgi:hypothetical protein